MKAFAILRLDKLKLYAFENRSEWTDAMVDLDRSGKPFLPLEWHHGACVYQVKERLGSNAHESAPTKSDSPFDVFDQLFRP